MRGRPSLLLLRLIVTRGDGIAYDEQFHRGVNIIRGTTNSTGKSTIADLIFFAIGGQGVTWTPEAATCHYVFAEVALSGTIATLRRRISAEPQASMDVYWGPYEKARFAQVTEWDAYPYAQRSGRESFSSVLFRELGLPTVKGELGARLTMYQLLRFLYSDQITSVDALLRQDAFDQTIIREAIGDLICGIYDDRLYEVQIELRDLGAQYAEAKNRHKLLLAAFATAEQAIGVELLEAELENAKKRRAELHDAVVAVRGNAAPSSSAGTGDTQQLQRIEFGIVSLRGQLTAAKERLRGIELEIEDSQFFMESLGRRLRALDQSIEVGAILRAQDFVACPACGATPLPTSTDETQCPLCKSSEGDYSQLSYARMRHELVIQIQESKKLQADRESRKKEVVAEIPGMETKLAALSLEHAELTVAVRAPIQSEAEGLQRQIGYTDGFVERLEEKLKLARALEDLGSQRSNLAEKIEQLESEREVLTQQRDRRSGEASSVISGIAVELVRSDVAMDGVAFETAFASAQSVAVDYGGNRFSVDGRTRFSASSTVILKSAVHLAMFLASFRLDYFRHPKWALLDNIEDKGMVPQRSQNFQRQIVERCNQLPGEFQVIFTTSMIASELDDPKYTVGQLYSPTSKTLRA
jgi:rubrerythrin